MAAPNSQLGEMLLFIRVCINNNVPAYQLRNLNFLVTEASLAGHFVLEVCCWHSVLWKARVVSNSRRREEVGSFWGEEVAGTGDFMQYPDLFAP